MKRRDLLKAIAVGAVVAPVVGMAKDRYEPIDISDVVASERFKLVDAEEGEWMYVGEEPIKASFASDQHGNITITHAKFKVE